MKSRSFLFMFLSMVIFGVTADVNSIEIIYKSLNLVCDERWVDYNPGNELFHEADIQTEFVCNNGAIKTCNFKYWTFNGMVDGFENTEPRVLNRSHNFESANSGYVGPHPVAWYYCPSNGTGPPSIQLVAINITDGEIIAKDFIESTNPANHLYNCGAMTCGAVLTDPASGAVLQSVVAKARLSMSSFMNELVFVQWDLDGNLQVAGERTLTITNPSISHFATAFYKRQRIQFGKPEDLNDFFCKQIPGFCGLIDICDKYPELCPPFKLCERFPELCPYFPFKGKIIVDDNPFIVADICKYISGSGIDQCPGCEGGPGFLCGFDLTFENSRDYLFLMTEKKSHRIVAVSDLSFRKPHRDKTQTLKIDEALLKRVGGHTNLNLIVLPRESMKSKRPTEIKMNYKIH